MIALYKVLGYAALLAIVLGVPILAAISFVELLVEITKGFS